MRLLLPILAFAAGLGAFSGPALAAARLVPQTATGALEPYRGEPWYKAMENCAGFHVYNARRLSAASDGAGSEAAMTRAADFMMPAARRISEDGGITFSQGLEVAKPDVQNYATAIEFTASDEPDFITGWTEACDEILAGYNKTFG